MVAALVPVLDMEEEMVQIREEEEVRKRYREGEWKYFFTGTLATDPTRGAVFMALDDFTRRMPEADYLLWLADDASGRAHAHGVITAPVSARAVNGAWKGGFAQTRPYAPELGGRLWEYLTAHDYRMTFTKE
jgi:hypothetical protein